MRSLQPVVLMHDTWVTNHGYRDGRAVPFQSVLQAGTAVLIDAYGVPRVQCGCGNPLAPRWTGYVVPTSGTPWPGYNPTYVINIYAPEYHNTTINVTNIYEEGDEYNVTFEEAVEPDRPDLATAPADMGVRPDEDDKTTSGKCDITIEIKDSRGRVVYEDEDANVSCRQEFTFPDLEEGSYTAHVTVESRDGRSGHPDQRAERPADK